MEPRCSLHTSRVSGFNRLPIVGFLTRYYIFNPVLWCIHALFGKQGHPIIQIKILLSRMLCHQGVKLPSYELCKLFYCHGDRFAGAGKGMIPNQCRPLTGSSGFSPGWRLRFMRRSDSSSTLGSVGFSPRVRATSISVWMWAFMQTNKARHRQHIDRATSNHLEDAHNDGSRCRRCSAAVRGASHSWPLNNYTCKPYGRPCRTLGILCREKLRSFGICWRMPSALPGSYTMPRPRLKRPAALRLRPT